MNVKKAIIIGLLSASIIGLIAVGIKTNSFDKDNTKIFSNPPKTKLKVSADNVTPTSLNWILDEQVDYSAMPNYTNFTSNFYLKVTTTYNNSTHTTEMNTTIGSSYLKTQKVLGNIYYIYKDTAPGGHSNVWNNGGIPVYDSTQTAWVEAPSAYNNLTQNINSNNARLMNFNNAPTGDQYAWLQNNATPYYNNNVIITNKSPVIHQIRKSNTIITQNPQIINTDGQIEIYLDAGLNKLYINSTEIISQYWNNTVNYENRDISIQAYGTYTGTIGYVYKINYTNTLTPIEPEPIPDPTQPVYEVLDIRGLMLNILTMPFAFITQAFDITLWPNTQYEFNIGNFIMAIISIMALLFIIKLFTSGFSILGNYTNSRNNNKLTKTKIEESKSRTALNNRTDPNRKTIKKE